MLEWSISMLSLSVPQHNRGINKLTVPIVEDLKLDFWYVEQLNGENKQKSAPT